MVVVNKLSPTLLQTTRIKFIGGKFIKIEKEQVGKRKTIGRIGKGITESNGG